MGCFTDYRITAWLENDNERTAARALDFKGFMALVRERLLPSDWERTLKQERNSRKQEKHEPFLAFLTSVERLNSFLINTAHHLDDTGLRTLLESNMTTDLADDVADEGKVTDATKYKEWSEIVKRRDNIRIRRIKELHAIADERAKRERTKTTTNDERPQKRKRDENAPPSGPSTSSSSAPASSSGNGKRCPKLTEDERALLADNHGCSRCRKPFVDHADAQDKTCPWPNAIGYKPVSQTSVDAAAVYLTADQRAKFGVKAKPTPVAAVVAAVGFAPVDDPNDSSVDSENVSEPHLVWDFRMEGPMSNLPIQVRGLIDNGSGLVLIHQDVVDRLALRRHPLHEPVPVSAAFTNSDDPPPLTEWVKFKALSDDLSYETNTVRALIAPDLCTDVILGLPFLKRNSIVVDHADATVIDKPPRTPEENKGGSQGDG
ncbi:hypothetical protein DFH09DRAFT_1340216 [Mycena vulgaris]|nr:hypothetical protein DFH09DRAFT_1340216 [Mycena vulgaris]